MVKSIITVIISLLLLIGGAGFEQKKIKFPVDEI